ncbi:lemA family protein [bacterium BMS3Abin03]|nr:lemA family protein [bacterium BMS3Abin03]
MNIVVISIVALVIIWLVITYNLFVRDRNLISEAWSGIDVQLKRRHNLIPNLVEIVKSYSKYERELFNEITEKRTKTVNIENIKEKATAETDLSGMLKSLFAVVENYPDLKANVNYLDLQNQLTEIEDQIQYARRYYNGTVRNYNIRVESFPGNIVAGIFDFKQEDYFEITLATERKTPEVDL